VLWQAFFLFLFFIHTRSINAPLIIITTTGAFGISTYSMFAAGSMARKRDQEDVFYNCGVAFLVANTFLLITVEFATLYWSIGTTANFNVELSRIDAIYFALGTLTTAGTGTIAPTSDLARAIVGGQMILDLVFVAYVLTVTVTRWSKRSS
jgi:hypothetical protein